MMYVWHMYDKDALYRNEKAPLMSDEWLITKIHFIIGSTLSKVQQN